MNDLIHHLFTFHKVQLSVFPEFISFLRGRKRILRIVVDDCNQSFDDSLFYKYGLYVSQVDLFSSKQKNSFGSLVPEIDDRDYKHFNKVKMFSISKFEKELNDFQQAELFGDVEKAGAYLGYPTCCVKNISIINSLQGLWATFYLEDFIRNSEANLFTNRFPITWGGISIVGELFPCSLSCKKAIEYGKGLHNEVKTYGFGKISEVMLYHATNPIYINSADGGISKHNYEDFQPIIFT